jgi:hypothetical protein
MTFFSVYFYSRWVGLLSARLFVWLSPYRLSSIDPRRRSSFDKIFFTFPWKNFLTLIGIGLNRHQKASTLIPTPESLHDALHIPASKQHLNPRRHGSNRSGVPGIVWKLGTGCGNRLFDR